MKDMFGVHYIHMVHCIACLLQSEVTRYVMRGC